MLYLCPINQNFVIYITVKEWVIWQINYIHINITDTTDTYNIGGLSANDIIDENIRDLKIKFGIDNINIENHRLPNMCWIPKMHKNSIKARFVIASPKSSIKPLASIKTSIFRLFFRQIQT